MKAKVELYLAVVAIATFALGTTVEAEEFDPCSLLSNPAMREQLSSALETKLMILCGEITQAEVRQRQTTIIDDAVVDDPGLDIRVNDPALDVGGTTQSETSVVAVDSTVCAAFNDSGEGFRTSVFNGLSGFGFSNDGGLTFIDGGPFPNGPGPDRNFGAPSLAFSVRDNAFYYAALSTVGLSLWKSTDNCQSFRYVGPIHAGGGDDKELMAIDNNPTSPFYGRIYVGWINFALANDRNQTTFSNNGGATWSAPVSLPGSGTVGQGMWPAVAPNGDVYFALLIRSFVIGGLQDQRIWRSTNGGAAWTRMTDIATGQRRPEHVASSNACGRQALNGAIRNLSSPQIAIHRDSAAPAGYVIHAVYPYDSDGAGPDESNVFHKRSRDGAVTWSAEKMLNDDGTTTDQWFPALAVNSTGTVAVSWYDRRLDQVNNLNFDRFAVVSTDGGLTWGANTRISDVSSPVAQTNPNFDVGLATCYHGDYDQVAAVAGNQCPLTQGFWENHPNAWPVSSLTLGRQTYTQAELLAILRTPVRGDASLILTYQLIAAKLNSAGGTVHIVWSDDRRITATGPNPDVYYDQLTVAHGSDPAPISATITDADSVLSGFAGKLPYGVKPSSATGQRMVNDATALDAYNNGNLTPDCTP
jgi:hypothetical protein